MRTLQGKEKTNIRPPSMPGPCELFSILMHYVCIRERGEMSFSPPLCGHVCVLDSANSDLHFPSTACERLSDVGSVIVIIYKAWPCALSAPSFTLTHTHMHTHAHTAGKDSWRKWGRRSVVVITNRARAMEIYIESDSLVSFQATPSLKLISTNWLKAEVKHMRKLNSRSSSLER